MSDTRIIKHNNNTIELSKSDRKNKKYKAVITFHNKFNKDGSNKVKTVHFGGIRLNGTPYEQYKDSTGLGYYSKYDHNDRERRRKYYERHGATAKPYSAKWLSHRYLW